MKKSQKPKVDLKTHLTNTLIEKLGYDQKDFKKLRVNWWVNYRKKEIGGLRLTEEGYEAFQKLEVEEHNVDIPENIEFTSQLILWLDRFIECPFYLTRKRITVFDATVAIQLILFSGNIQKYGIARAKAVAKKQQNTD